MISQLLSGRSRLIVHLTGWLLVFLSFYYLISEFRGPGEVWLRTSLNMSFMLVLFYGNAKLLVNRYLEKGLYGRLVGLTIIFWLGMVFLRTWLEVHLFVKMPEKASFFSEDWKRIFLVSLVSFFLLIFFSTLYQLVENRQVIELQHRTLEARHTQAQLDYLKAQINPHFLFNTLHNIYAAAVLQHPRTADMVLRLSDLLRYVTYDAQATQVPLEKEVDQINACLELYQMKSDVLLPIYFVIEGDLTTRSIEPLLLLPFVENALKHGDLEANSTAFLRITLRNEPNSLVFMVENSFNPDDQQKDSTNSGVGLENVRQRLELNYPRRHRFEHGMADNAFLAVLELHDLN